MVVSSHTIHIKQPQSKRPKTEEINSNKIIAMFNYPSLVLLVIIFCSCSEQQANNTNALQNQFIEMQIENSRSKLIDKVEDTGYSPAGKRLIELSEQVSDRTNELIAMLSTNNSISASDIEELIEMADDEHATVNFDTTFLKESFKNYNSLDTKNFETSLLLFNLDVVEKAREKLNSYFFDVEYFIPVVLSDKFNIKKGETFKGTAILQAKMVGVKY